MQSNRSIRDQFEHVAGQVHTKSPEERLMLAVLEEAIATFQSGLVSPVPERRRTCCEAERWLSSKDTDHLFSFESICGTFAVDPDYVRQGLLQWKQLVLQRATSTPQRKLRRDYPHGRRDSIPLSISRQAAAVG